METADSEGAEWETGVGKRASVERAGGCPPGASLLAPPRRLASAWFEVNIFRVLYYTYIFEFYVIPVSELKGP